MKIKFKQPKEFKYNLNSLLLNLDRLELGRNQDVEKKDYLLFNNHPSREKFTLSETFEYLGKNRTDDVDSEMILSEKRPSLKELYYSVRGILPPEQVRNINKEIALKSKVLNEVDFNSMLEDLSSKIPELKKSKELTKEEKRDQIDEIKVRLGQLRTMQKKHEKEMQKALSNQKTKTGKILKFPSQEREVA